MTPDLSFPCIIRVSDPHRSCKVEDVGAKRRLVALDPAKGGQCTPHCSRFLKESKEVPLSLIPLINHYARGPGLSSAERQLLRFKDESGLWWANL